MVATAARTRKSGLRSCAPCAWKRSVCTWRGSPGSPSAWFPVRERSTVGHQISAAQALVEHLGGIGRDIVAHRPGPADDARHTPLDQLGQAWQIGAVIGGMARRENQQAGHGPAIAQRFE